MPTNTPTTFHVTAHWDPEANVFYSRTNIPGLVVETETFDEFVDVVHDLAPDVLAANLPDIAPPYRITVKAQRKLVLAAA
jgi:Domain of unknown function (DUF1902)